ncbi:hypothetical protein CONPUDRAFT_87482 [Coniophora puteana RWD-64-598 SS2]|uniref:Prokaryotic-type class I peptide chain release factors domain-containing protein n=1 Tax=Coniophora puteana (strain RWD-64-598) TaxID=741705 RepID=A0A5M3N1U1_CONPW|nr:uncharacterized protein CONPUDRAFT_87482 [Coniophora puteana RWD-64-598 SS2]EIW84984.1 hypothetical protein CONPUDRAFT_87482 [Coniophora puteana RWD-64-598 SS2]
MSITPALKASARSAYRDLLRASAVTFSGDAPVRQAFKVKMRTQDLALTSEQANAPAELQGKITLARDIATILRKNIVQARKVEGQDTWRLQFTKDTELGDNESIKEPPPVSDRQARRREKGGPSSPETAAPPDRQIPRNYSTLKKASKSRTVPELKEEDIEESFVRGSGPGGQSINKTENNVQLLHKPTGIRVSCQETRSLQTNRMLARRRLTEKLDVIENPGISKAEMGAAKQRERERRRRKKAKKRQKAKQEDLEEEDSED